MTGIASKECSGRYSLRSLTYKTQARDRSLGCPGALTISVAKPVALFLAKDDDRVSTRARPAQTVASTQASDRAQARGRREILEGEVR